MNKKYSKYWGFEKGKIPLNHGSFGACPEYVLDKQNKYRKQMESLTTRFFLYQLPPLLEESHSILAGFLNTGPENLAFIPNATTGANIVLANLQLNSGDEIITTPYIYESCDNLLKFYRDKKNIVLKYASIPFLPRNNEQIISAVQAEITERTKLIFIDHITSSTALIFPVEQIVKLAKENNIKVFIDGAHAPGMIDLDLNKLRPDFYTGNAHKWLCSPKGAAFLYVAEENQNDFFPLVISNHYGEGTGRIDRFRNKFDWQGTGDYTPYICIKDSVQYLSGLFPGGWNGIREYNHSLACRAKKLIMDTYILKYKVKAIDDIESLIIPDEMTGSIALIPFNEGSEFDPNTGLDILQVNLLKNFGIETMFVSHNGKRFLRISSHIYNSPEDYEYLVKALEKEM